MLKKTTVFSGLIFFLTVFSALAGDAIQKYDAVAYFTDARAEKGSAEFQTEWNGASWYFSNAGHLALFKADPAKYAPQYGGHCAYAASKGSVAPANPAAWTVVNGKLYLNYNGSVKSLWERDRDANIRKADQNWPGLEA